MRIGEYEFKTRPMGHQVKALRDLIEHKGTRALLMDPGTGKTKPIIDYLGLLWTRFGQIDWMVTAPLAALDTWPAEFDKHLPESVPLRLIVLDTRYTIQQKIEKIEELAGHGTHLKLRVVLINHDAFASRARVAGYASKDQRDALEEVMSLWRPDGITVDESQRIKNPTANRSVAIYRVGKFTPRRQILTGTVTPRNPLDVYGQWRFLNESRFPWKWSEFQQRYAIWGGFSGYEVTRWINQDDLRKRIQKDATIVRKKDALDLPDYTDRIIPVRLGRHEQKAYNEMGDQLITQLPSGDRAIAPIVLTKILRLRQITGGFIGYEDDEYRRKTEILGDSKLRYLQDRLEDLIDADMKVVVFAHFKPDIARIHEMVAKKFKKIPCFRVEGATPNTQRKGQRRGFAEVDGTAVLVAQMRTMSLAVNELVASSHAIFYSLSERREDLDQARDRLYRHGQTEPVTFDYLTVPGSIDQIMLDAHRERTSLEQKLLENPTSLRLT